ncbi:DUF2232 domain-containing protein [Hydrogenovibrio halophilus]|uniref:DUF2232 domain-containing protein n=1 Tax=Hydrogenovibrio halophilus TaxID=373391 RepID=UPI0003814AB8|nr:DUF2232 domain-containing protein [Hydrogenovibrio halophilus]
MLSLANYVMRGPMQAWIATLILAVLTVWLAPLGLLLGAVIALVTLRVSETDGLKVLAIAVLATLALHQLTMGQLWPGLVAVMEYMLPVWLLAWALRQTQKLATPIHLAVMLAAGSVLAFHLIVGDTVTWWQAVMENYLAPLMTQAGADLPRATIEQISQVATMLLAMFLVMLWVVMILLARWWQSALYFPGKFREDFYQIRLPLSLAILAAVAAVGSLFTQSLILQDLAAVLMIGLMFQGLSVIHHAIYLKEMSKGWLIGLYIMLMLFPQVILILATVGLVDTWMDIRNRWTQA